MSAQSLATARLLIAGRLVHTAKYALIGIKTWILFVYIRLHFSRHISTLLFVDLSNTLQQIFCDFFFVLTLLFDLFEMP